MRVRKKLTKKTIKLPLTLEERYALRRARILLREVSSFTNSALSEATGLKQARCKMLIALAQFQTLGSIGENIAQALWDLGLTSVADLVDQDPYEMYQNYSAQVGYRVDPCVEDTFRCAVAQAKYPDLPKHLRQWWEWGSQRGQRAVNL